MKQDVDDVLLIDAEHQLQLAAVVVVVAMKIVVHFDQLNMLLKKIKKMFFIM